MSKFTIGSQWKTRGGWRAVVVEHDTKYMRVYHSNCKSAIGHEPNGRLSDSGNDAAEDLIEPWPEPRTGTVWVHVRVEEGVDYVDWHAHSKEFPAYEVGDKKTTIAKKRFDWVEGDGL